MLAFLLSPIMRWVAGGAVLLALLLGGYKLMQSRDYWKAQAMEKDKIIAKQEEVRKNVEAVANKLRGLTPEQLADYFRTGRMPDHK